MDYDLYHTQNKFIDIGKYQKLTDGYEYWFSNINYKKV